MGDKTTSLFERKKKDVEKLAAEKATEAQQLDEEQAKKTSDALLQTKNEAENLAASTGILVITFVCVFCLQFCFIL